jgi:hypothetical protein
MARLQLAEFNYQNRQCPGKQLYVKTFTGKKGRETEIGSLFSCEDRAVASRLNKRKVSNN